MRMRVVIILINLVGLLAVQALESWRVGVVSVVVPLFVVWTVVGLCTIGAAYTAPKDDLHNQKKNNALD